MLCYFAHLHNVVMAKIINDQVRRRFLDANEEPTQQLKPIEGYEKKLLISLQQSMKPIKDLVDDEQIANSEYSKQIKKIVGDNHLENFVSVLDKYIWLAKLKATEPKDNLTADELAAIHLYTMQWPDSDDNLCTILNKILRSESRDILKPWFSYLKLLLTALFKLPSTETVIWRGIRGNVNEEYKKDKIWWGFSSCTESQDVCDRFLGKCGERTIFKINCINGKDIRHYSVYQDEEEILLMPGTYLHVIDKSHSADGLWIIHLQEKPAPHELLKPPFNLYSKQLNLTSHLRILVHSNYVLMWWKLPLHSCDNFYAKTIAYFYESWHHQTL